MATRNSMPLRAAPTTADKIVVDLSFGRANYATSSTSLACMKVTAPFARISASSSGRKLPGTKVYTMAGPQGSNGGFTRERVEHANGTILLLQVTRMSRGIRVAEGAIFVRLRDTGPMYEVYGILPTSHQNVIGDEVSFAVFRGDLMTVDQLTVAGIEVPRQFRDRFLQADEIQETLVVAELQPEIKPRPQLVAIATDTGIVHQEIAAAPARRMRFRKG